MGWFAISLSLSLSHVFGVSGTLTYRKLFQRCITLIFHYESSKSSVLCITELDYGAVFLNDRDLARDYAADGQSFVVPLDGRIFDVRHEQFLVAKVVVHKSGVLWQVGNSQARTQSGFGRVLSDECTNRLSRIAPIAVRSVRR
jgi:hypothetical protein